MEKLQDQDINNAIKVLERRDLDLTPSLVLADYGRKGNPLQFNFLRINAISRFLPENKAEAERFVMEDVLAGIHGLNVPFIYLIIGTKLKINIYLGILSQQSFQTSSFSPINILKASLESTFPDIEVELLSSPEIDENIFKFFQNSAYLGILTGVPTPKFGGKEQGVEQIERLIRGLYGQEFGYMVLADPVKDKDIIAAFDDVANIIRDKSLFIKEARQYVQTSRMTISGESLNKSVQYYIELLEIFLEKLKLGKTQGMWRTMTYFFSPHADTVNMMRSLLKTVFSGENSKPEAIRTLLVEKGNAYNILSQFKQIELELNFHPAFAEDHPLRKIIQHKFVTVLPSRDLATLTHLPKEEMPGYDVKDTARFGVCFPKFQDEKSILLGEIIDRGKSTGNYYRIATNDLDKHGLIVGVTGSGKTNTCLYILDQLWKGTPKIPFLVIEPAKAEYRQLLNVQGFEDLQIFTLGDEVTSAFRLNPFEIIEGVKLQTHIDNLRAVFNASFVMYAPMPYVLERCIHEIYVDKGWDLITNQNRYLNEKNASRLFPTLTDLYEKIDEVVDSLGYEERLRMDIKAGLKARVGSLRIGGKGSMLDTALSIPMEILLNKPTILELQSIGDDEEKAFIIGLLIARLYEYREVESKQRGKNIGLRHVTLIEEAHRLLTKTSSDLSNLETVNTKAKAVETFCNILSEIRAFGEGILIAEQIPSKLAQDAIKNTNLKVMHRIVAKDDRDLICNTMNLNENQNRFVSIMGKGEAVVFSEGVNESFLVKVPHYKNSVKIIDEQKKSIQDKDVAQFMAQKLLALKQVYARSSGCAECPYKCFYRDTSNYILSKPDSMNLISKYIFACIGSANNFKNKYDFVKENLLADIRPSIKEEKEVKGLMTCLLINGGERFLLKKARQYNFPLYKIYPLKDDYDQLINSFISNAGNFDANLHEFRQCYLETFSLDGPFPGCNEFCKLKCIFRYDIEPFLFDNTIERKMLNAIKSGQRNKGDVKKLCLELAKELTLGNQQEFIENIALCFFIQKSIQWSVEEVIRNIESWFLRV